MSRPRLPAWIRRMLARKLARPVRLGHTKRRRRACLFKVDRLGDFVLATGAIRTLLTHYGPAECRLIVSATAEPLARLVFPEVALSVLPTTAQGVWRDLRPLRGQFERTGPAEHYDDLVCLRHQPSTYRDVALGWPTASRRLGLDLPAPGEILSLGDPGPPRHYPVATALPWCRELRAHAAVVAQATGRDAGWADLRPHLSNLTATRGETVVFCPFGSEAIRDYPRAAWRQAWAGLAGSQLPDRVVLLGPPDRQDDLVQLGRDLRLLHPSLRVELPGRIDTRAFIEQIASARAIVTVESAAAHLATAVGKPAVILVGGGHFGWLAPWGDDPAQHWLSHALPCFDCNWRCHRPTTECLEQLPPVRVAAALAHILAR